MDSGEMSGLQRFLILALAGAFMAFAAGVIVAPLAFKTPRFVTALGANAQPVSVPDVTGRARQDAQRDIESAGLVLAGQWSEYGELETMGQVARQDPPAGTQVPRGSPVSIFWNIGPLFRPYHPEMLPGLSATEAEGLIADWQLYTAGRSRAPHPAVPEGYVIAVCPWTSESLSVEVPVRLLVSTGWDGIPVFRGMQITEAESIATVHDLVLLVEGTAVGEPDSTVSTQAPAAGTSFQPGDTVRVTLFLSGAAASLPGGAGEVGEGWGAW
jgi:eukaryotic-like serine/threonine-protein kinase